MASLSNGNLHISAKFYNYILRFYDFLALTFNCNFLWLCPTKTVLLPFFRANAGEWHMDVGVGTGHNPAALHELDPSWPKHLALVDINTHCLKVAAERIGLPTRTTCITADIIEPFSLPASEPQKFDSISLMYTLHCLPYPPAEKGRVFTNLKQHLSPQGTLFGSTILGRDGRHNLLARVGLWWWNLVGVINNLGDGKDDFHNALEAEFEEVESYIVGCVLLFRARKPKESEKIPVSA